MKKLLFVLIFGSLLFGCEMYEDETYPQLSGQWVLTSVNLSNGGSTPNGTYHVLSDTILLQSYKPVNINGNIIQFSQTYNDPTVQWYDKFVIGQTVWEFETNLLGIPTTIGGQRGYLYESYYSINRDLYSRKYNSITIAEGGRHIGIESYGLEELRLVFPRFWTMFRRNTNVEFFFQETIILTFRRI